jgi:hypothetical protein
MDPQGNSHAKQTQMVVGRHFATVNINRSKHCYAKQRLDPAEAADRRPWTRSESNMQRKRECSEKHVCSFLNAVDAETKEPWKMQWT